MNPPLNGKSFRRLLDNLQEPIMPAQTEPSWPYPLAEEEMMARYGLRPLTPEEQAVFPGVRLALRVFKARLTQPPAGLVGVKAGWVVWVAETYRGHYLARIPGCGTLLAPYCQMEWVDAPAETPVTTWAAAQVEAQQRQQRQTLRRRLRQCLLLPDAD